jgi:hypothetical protein
MAHGITYNAGRTGARRQPDSAWNAPAQAPNTGVGPSPQAEPASQSQPQPQQPQPTYEEPRQNNYDYQEEAQPTNVGHDGTINGQTREQWRDAWMSSGTKSAAGTDSWLANNGATKLANNGTFLTPFGEVLDLGQNYRTNVVTPAWTQTGGGVGPSYSPDMGGGSSPSFMQGVDPALLTAFQDYLANANKPAEPVVAPRVAARSGVAPLAKRAFDPRSMTMQRQRY